jgi:hypothetical protein
MRFDVRSPVRPDASTAELVQRSAHELTGRDPRLLERIVTPLVADVFPGTDPDPSAAARFELPAEIVHALLLAALGTVRSDDVERHWQRLGVTAFRNGWSDEDLVRIGHALLRAVRDGSGDDWSSGLSSAWMAYHLWMSSHLTIGLARGRAAAPAAADPAAQPR